MFVVGGNWVANFSRVTTGSIASKGDGCFCSASDRGASFCQGTTGSIAGEAGTCFYRARVESVKVYVGQLLIRKIQHKISYFGRVGVADIGGGYRAGRIVEVNIVGSANVESFGIGRWSRCCGVQCGDTIDRRRGIRRCIAIVYNAIVATVDDNTIIGAAADCTIIAGFLRGHGNSDFMSNARKSRTGEREAEVELLGGLLGGHISVFAGEENTRRFLWSKFRCPSLVRTTD
jgi:hypothetical protein